MKKILFLLMFFFFIPFVFADIETEEFNVYVDDEHDDDVNKDGGKVEVYEKDELELKIKIKNTYNESVSIKLKARIYDIDDDGDLFESKEFDIDSDDTITKSLYFDIPETNDETYDAKIYYEWEWDGTDYEKKIDFEVKVLKKDDEESDSSCKEALNNLSSFCFTLGTKLDSTLDYADRWGICQNVKATFEEKSKNLEAYETKYHNCSSKLETTTTNFNNCENDKRSMVSESQCDDDIEEAKQDSNQILYVAGGIFAVWFFFIRKKKEEAEGGAADLELTRV